MDQQNETMGGTQTEATQSAAPVTAVPQASTNDGVSEHKLWAIVGYILPFLFFIPMLDEKSKHNAFARFHANQQLTLLAIGLGIYVVSNILLGMFMMGLFFIMPLINLALLVLVVLGVIHAAQGEMKELPVVGGIKLLDKVFRP
ncbi:MAG: hypothetical protein RLZZ76_156 [Candidatus Parcubacteria bacterium]|jgi:uncharacterized membrane protein